MIGLGQRIECCRHDGLFGLAEYRAAVELKDAGNDAIHNVPQTAPDLDRTMARLASALAALERKPPRREP
jgi:hypothetical protein